MADKNIGTLPKSTGLYDDALFVTEHSGTAESVTGKQFKDYARQGVEVYVEDAMQASQIAVAAAGRAETAANAADISKDTAKISQTASETAAKDAIAAKDISVAASAQSANSAKASQSWAVGGTGTRPGEDNNNSEYYARVAQAEADRATIPVIEGGYNLVIRDRVTGLRYALAANGGELELLEVTETVEDLEGGLYNVVLQDKATAEKFAIILEDGVLILFAMSQATNVTRTLVLVDASGSHAYTMAAENGQLYLEEVS